MARFRISWRARSDLTDILVTSARRWGSEGRRRYASTLLAAMREVASNPDGPATHGRPELKPGIRSFHVRHTRGDDAHMHVRSPVHVLYYRVVRPGVIEIVRVLHERMEPSRHLGAVADEND